MISLSWEAIKHRLDGHGVVPSGDLCLEIQRSVILLVLNLPLRTTWEVSVSSHEECLIRRPGLRMTREATPPTLLALPSQSTVV